MTYTFIKAKGGKIGNSLVEDDKLELALDILEACEKQNVQVHLPVDNKIADQFNNDANIQTVAIDEIIDGWMGLDIGPKSEKLFAEVINNSKTILWNGPWEYLRCPTSHKEPLHWAKPLLKQQNGAFHWSVEVTQLHL